MDEPKSNLPKKEQGELLIIDGDPEVENPCMFEIGLYFSMFYCLCYVKEISTDMLEGKVSEQRDPDLNEQEDIRMDYSREYHCRDVADDGEYKKNIHALTQDFYKIEKEDFIRRQFYVSVTYLKGGNIVWYFVKDKIIDEK